MGNKKILIIEDSSGSFNNLQRIINDLGYKTIPEDHKTMRSMLDNGYEALKKYVLELVTEHCHTGLRLIICDLKMKDDYSYGIKLLKDIRTCVISESRYFSKIIPAIAYTGVACSEKDLYDVFNLKVDKITKAETENEKRKIVELKTDIKNFVKRFEEDLKQVNSWQEEIEKFKATNSAFINGFVMMPFSDENKKTVDYLNDCLKEHNIKLHIANASGGKNKGSLWPDIEVFMNACDFGIAIYTDDSKRKKENKINPNVTIETGYMLGLQKMVYVCKHEELEKFNEEYSDLKHAIYISFSDKDTLLNGLKEKLKNEGYIIQQK